MQYQVASDRGYIRQQSRQLSPLRTEHFQMGDNQQEIAKIPTSFVNQQYPTQFSLANPFCPTCGNFIAKDHSFMIFQSLRKKKKYMIHTECLKTQDRNDLALSDSIEAKLQSIAFLNQIRSLALGGKEFYIEIQVLHPLGGRPLTKLWTKLKSIGTYVTWDFKANAEADCFSPNIVAFPFPDFELSINLFEFGQKQSQYAKKIMISVGRLGGNEVQFVKAYTPDLQITMKVIGNKQQQEKTIDEMNLKYQYPLVTGTALVEIVRIHVKLPDEDSDDDDDHFSRNTFSIPELTSQKTSHRQSKGTFNGQALSERSFDREKVDLEKLIASDKLGQFVRQNTQSRVFQGWLGEASPREVDQVIVALWQEFPELITHQYANYMIQKLMGVCSLPQRIRIVQRLQSDIPGIARNKQGTHSLQTLITLFSTDEQYKLVTDSIKTTFLNLSQHPNATHFLQKIISLFPLKHTYNFIEIILNDFLSYALDKHGMCVIKQMIKKISQTQGNGKEGLAYEARKRIVHEVNFKIDQLISDPYGNYIIQFCYELFGEEKCGGITERIIDKILQFSLQKYSSAVIFKCISTFWLNKDNLNKLKNALTSDIIQQMYRNKQSNKILLELCEKYDGSALRQKIQHQVMLNEPTKFNHERWGVTLGSRSGTVGGFSSFSDAARKPTKKKKKFNNDR